MKSNLLPIGLVQMTCVPDRLINRGKANNLIMQAAKTGARIICLQELYSTEYFCDTENYDHFALAEPLPGEYTQELARLARSLEVVIIASLFEKVDAGIYFNTAVVINADGNYLGKYRKNHIPDDPGYYEKFYFSPGDMGYRIFETRYARIGVLVCWDQWYPEAARITSLMGAQVLFYPTAIGWADGQTPEVNREQHDAWQTIQRAHAIANGVHVVVVNRTGKEKNMQFWGSSFVADPFGKVLWQAPQLEETVGVVEADLSLSDFYRTHWPYMRDRRIDTYAPLLNRYIHPLNG